ncbi:MAG: hypothetical protein ROZ64_14715 [Burkholderiaceae bacterium]|jgi:hypothetical protein|nr:hypothetical protein [Burkholderiaceae bacterium]
MNMTQAVTLNGLDLERTVATVDAIKAQPSLGHFEFRARNRWIDGGENRSTIRDFYGAAARMIRGRAPSSSSTASRRSCSATTKERTRSSFCCTHWPGA